MWEGGFLFYWGTLDYVICTLKSKVQIEMIAWLSDENIFLYLVKLPMKQLRSLTSVGKTFAGCSGRSLASVDW